MRLLFSLGSVLLAGGLVCASVRGEDASAAPIPPPQTEYKGRKIAQTMHWQGAEWLTRHQREAEEAASVMFRELGLKPGQTVCDLGSGNGYHTLPMARAVVPGGKVYAVDIQDEMLLLLQARAKKSGVENIEFVLGKLDDPCLPADSQDLILLVDAYHEFSHPEEMLRGVRRALKPEGLLALVEYRAEDDTVPIREEHKMSRVQILKELTENGFEEVRSFDKLPWQHLIFFRRTTENADKSETGNL